MNNTKTTPWQKWNCANCKHFDTSYMSPDNLCNSKARYHRDRDKRTHLDGITFCVDNTESCKYWSPQ